MSYKLSALSTEYIRYETDVEEAGVKVDPTGFTVDFALADFATDAAPSTWITGEWETDTGPPIKYYARLLVGPGVGAHTNPGAGKYHVWIRVTGSPDVPVRLVGVLTIE